ncbi:ABC transporter substrate-binding protein [Pseudonocardia sp. NPDC049635]|uniref:ABC transporter substrate-binding protein n=1 Tax=Pseudonocardia sp. NPDC049635 TaxID=3155506 RepID=UPI0033D92A9F
MLRTFLPAVVAAALLAGCSAPAAGPADQAADSAAAFPVTVTHRLGETVVAQQPTRVVALGVADADVAAALGVTPVAAAGSPYSADGVWPWAVGTLDPGRTEILDTTSGDGLSLEKVAALDPDLILAHSFAGIDALYPQLSAIAPTVADTAGVLADSWQDEARSVGAALGRSDRAEHLVAEVEADLERTRTAHPGLDGAAFVVGWAREPGSIAVTGRPDDITADLFAALGMHLDDEVAALPRQEGSARGAGAATVSFEQLAVLDTDLLLLAASTPELAAQVTGSPLFERLTVARDGRYQVVDLATVSALRLPTAGNIPWLLNQLDPVLGKVNPS